jgi:AP-1 complex subunit mu
VQYAPDKSAFVWKIKQLGGGREFLMRAHFGLPSVKNGTGYSELLAVCAR